MHQYYHTLLPGLSYWGSVRVELLKISSSRNILIGPRNQEKGSVDVSRGGTALLAHNMLVPALASGVLSSIAKFHYVDFGLNCAGAYITDHAVIKGIANYVCHTSSNLCVVLRQWSWIRTALGSVLRKMQSGAYIDGGLGGP
jgi:hypothetical protein